LPVVRRSRPPRAFSCGHFAAAYTSAVAAAAVSGVIPAPPEASAILPPTLYGALLGYPSVYSLPSDQSEGCGERRRANSASDPSAVPVGLLS
jgi:hypothetical protein